MPIYEYVCRSCRHAFEQIVHGSKRPKCPSCGAGSAEKQLSVFATAVKEGSSDGFESAGSCGSCGDPRGPGSCGLN